MTSADQIAVASGIVAEQTAYSIAAAMLILRIRAVTTGRSVDAVAVAVIDRHEAAVR
jgi:hypothetical protein